MFGRKRSSREARPGSGIPEWHVDVGLAWGGVRAGGTKRWEPPKRVLVEQPDGGVAWATERVLRREGWDVAVCPGPEHLRGDGCPLLTGGRCSAVEGADAIVFALPLSSEKSRLILRAHRPTAGSRPVCVETATRDAEAFAAAQDAFTLLREPIVASALVDALDAALSAPAQTASATSP